MLAISTIDAAMRGLQLDYICNSIIKKENNHTKKEEEEEEEERKKVIIIQWSMVKT